MKMRTAEDRETCNITKRLLELGWQGVAWNQTIFGKPSQHNVNTKLNPVSLASADLTTALRNRSMVVTERKSSGSAGTLLPLTQWHRITVLVDDVLDAHCLTTSNEFLRRFDIVAATPSDGKVLSYLCREADVDVISIDFSKRLSFPINKKIVSLHKFSLKQILCATNKYG